ncbi:MAG: hypothetical protein R2822_20425 [Spirosomataceae bacterium]
MCNPPGGDWSGISYFDFADKQNIVGLRCREFQQQKQNDLTTLFKFTRKKKKSFGNRIQNNRKRFGRKHWKSFD